jgi:hypothetical protein
LRASLCAAFPLVWRWRSDEGEGTWKWQYDGNDMFMDIDEEARAARERQLHALCKQRGCPAHVTLPAQLTPLSLFCALPPALCSLQVRFRVAGVRFPARPISSEALRCVHSRCTQGCCTHVFVFLFTVTHFCSHLPARV